MGLRTRGAVRLARFAGVTCALVHSGYSAAADSWFADIERYTNLRQIRLDVAAPEPASFTALGVAPFLTAQALASADMAFSVAQVIDDYGNPRAAFGIDFAPTLVTGTGVTLGDYQRSHSQRVVSRLQLSIAVSKGESAQDRSTRVAPTLRIVFHQQRDPRVHRGPGSLQDCFERHVKPTEDLREKFATESEYRAALQESVRLGMKKCRDDPEVAAYAWNASGFALGISPSFGDDLDDLGSLRPRGVVVYATQAFGFDRQGRLPTYAPSFFGAHAQVITQLLYRLNEPLLNPLQPGSLVDADELVASLRLRGGSAHINGTFEAAVIQDWFEGQRNDTLTKFSVGMDAHLARGVWLSLSLGRTVWRDAIPNQTSAGLSIKWTVMN
jgi:hypothetical protein